MEDAQGPRKQGAPLCRSRAKVLLCFPQTWLKCRCDQYDHAFKGYKILAAPMAYMFREGFAERVRDFVAQGGIFITTYHSGIVDATDCCYLGATPAGLYRFAWTAPDRDRRLV